jgi:hypothetical protein
LTRHTALPITCGSRMQEQVLRQPEVLLDRRGPPFNARKIV